MTPLDQFRTTRLANFERVALIDATDPNRPPIVLRHGELDSATIGLAALLHDRRLEPGDRVAVMLPNGVDFALLYLACLHAGLVVVPINASSPDNIVSFISAASRPALLVCDGFSRQRFGHLRVPTWAIVKPGTLLAAACDRSDATILRNDDPSALFSITFTSGTTSCPKGVCHRAGSVVENASFFNNLTGLSADSRMVHVMPMAYMAGFHNTILSPLAAGGSVVLSPPFNAATALQFWTPAVAHSANAVWLSPTMAVFLARLNRDSAIAEWTHRHMHAVFIGTAPLPATTKRVFEEAFGVEALESYGMTEVMFVSCNSVRFRRKAGSVGRLLALVEAESRDPSGRSLPVGQEGELWIRSPQAMVGYLDPDTSQSVQPLADGWLATGDVGRVDADGDLFITGRLKDMIIRGGANVSPRAVEEVLLTCPGIRDAAVIGIPHAFWGEEVIAVLLLQPGMALDQVQAHAQTRCRAELPTDAVPARFVVQTEFPRTSTGKVQKSQLRESLQQLALLIRHS